MDNIRPNPVAPPPRQRLKWILGIIVILAVSVGIGFWLVKRSSRPRAIGRPGNIVTQDGKLGVIVQSQPPVDDPFPHDKDRDGISDEEEARAGTSDLEFDTDHDGLADTDEIKTWQTDPAKPDSDGDGYTDGFEIINGFNPKGAGKLQ